MAKLWARRKIASLADLAFEGARPEEVRAAVVEVALRHHLVSEHTSLVAVDRVPARPPEEGVRTRRLPVALPAGWNPSFVGTLPQGATGFELLALAGLALLGLAGAGLARETSRTRRRRPLGAAALPSRAAGRAS